MTLLAASEASAQCRAFTRSNVLPLLETYRPNENANSVLLRAGEEAELDLTFYANQDYRLVVAGHALLGDLQVTLVDQEQEVLYNNAEVENKNTFDFKVAGTQQLKVRVKVPETQKKGVMAQPGCVTILVGSK